jgi:hypothetical protein
MNNRKRNFCFGCFIVLYHLAYSGNNKEENTREKIYVAENDGVPEQKCEVGAKMNSINYGFFLSPFTQLHAKIENKTKNGVGILCQIPTDIKQPMNSDSLTEMYLFA